MTNMDKRTLLLGLFAICSPLLLVACGDGMGGMGGDDGSPEMLGMMGRRSMELPEGIAARELPDAGSRGAELMARYCSRCHSIPSPRRHTAEDWDATVRRMVRRMAHMERMGGGMMGRMRGRGMMVEVEAPSPGEEREILSYLRDHAMRAAVEEDLPPGDGRELFSRTCARCHALPDPGQHTREEWPAVVERMRGHMEKMEVEGISDARARRVVRYLRRAASGAGGASDG